MDTQCLRETAGAGSKAGMSFYHIPAVKHNVNAIYGFHCPDENSMGNTNHICDDIEKVVDTIAKVHIGSTPFGKHCFSTGSATVIIGMGCPVSNAGISFGFNNRTGCKFSVKMGANYLPQ
jgi:hypothetical protein